MLGQFNYTGDMTPPLANGRDVSRRIVLEVAKGRQWSPDATDDGIIYDDRVCRFP